MVPLILINQLGSVSMSAGRPLDAINLENAAKQMELKGFLKFETFVMFGTLCWLSMLAKSVLDKPKT